MNEKHELLDLFKKHIHFEEGMDDSMLSFYLDMATNYVRTATGGQAEYLILMVAAIAFEYRVSEAELETAITAITPFFIQEVINNAEAKNE